MTTTAAASKTKMTKAEQKVMDGIRESRSGVFAYSSGRGGRRVVNAILKLERAGVIRVERFSYVYYRRAWRHAGTDFTCTLAR